MANDTCPVNDMSLDEYTYMTIEMDRILKELDDVMTGEWDEKLDYRATRTGHISEVTFGLMADDGFVRTYVITTKFANPFSITVTDARNGTVIYTTKHVDKREFIDELERIMLSVGINKIETIERYTIDFRHKKVKNRTIVDVITKSKESDYY